MLSVHIVWPIASIRVRDRVAIKGRVPEAIIVDNRTEFRQERGVRLEFIQAGKPLKNAYIEAFNVTTPQRMAARPGAQTPLLVRASSPLHPRINGEHTLRSVQQTGTSL